MPRGDGSGPMGTGPMTGRGAGFCTGFDVPGYANPIAYGCALGRGRGGRGFRQMFYATALPGWMRFGGQNTDGTYFESADNEKEFLKRQEKFLENQLDNVKKRLEEFED